MKIKGFQGTSLLDFPGRIASLVFFGHCNLTCPFCHNPTLVQNPDQYPDYPLAELLAELKSRSRFIDGVVISGGEPTLAPGLLPLLREIRVLGLQVKLDTNGTKPQVLLALLNKDLIDYIAMDVKAPAEKYDEITRTSVEMDSIRRSIAMIRNSGIPHEFRLTFAPQLTLEDALETARMVKGCDRFYLQQYRPRNDQDPLAHAPTEVLKVGEAIAREIGNCTVRGLGPEQ